MRSGSSEMQPVGTGHEFHSGLETRILRFKLGSFELRKMNDGLIWLKKRKNETVSFSF